MKTIDKNKIKEAANNYVVSNFLENCTMKQYIIDSFETGFELCEQVFEKNIRWIPVEEKTPMTINGKVVSENVLVKDENYREPLSAYYNQHLKEWCAYPSHELLDSITHWRLIL